jgi:uncharacterized protein YchJ
MEQVLPLLKNLGISPEKITQEKIDKVKHMNLDFNNTQSFTKENCEEIMKILGIDLTPPKKTIKIPRIKRNESCPCGSNIKYKKCCGNSNET